LNTIIAIQVEVFYLNKVNNVLEVNIFGVLDYGSLLHKLLDVFHWHRSKYNQTDNSDDLQS